MRKGLVLSLVSSLIVFSCSSAPERKTSLPPLPEGIPLNSTTVTLAPEPTTPATCELAVTSKGAQVVSVISDSGSAGVVEVGDVIVAVDGRSVATSSDLVTFIRAQNPGQTVSVTAEREGESIELSVVLGEHPEVVGWAAMGVEVVTPVTMYQPGALPQAEVAGPLVRPVVADGSVFLLDPVTGSWRDLGLEAPEQGFATMNATIFTITERDQGPAFIEDIAAGTGAELATDEWGVPTVVTGFDGLAVAVAQSVETEDAFRTVLLGINVASGDVVWSWDPAADGEAGSLVVFAYVNPRRDRVVVLVGTADQTGVTGHAILDSAGVEQTGWPDQGRFLPPAALALGWFDHRSLLYVNQDGAGGVFAFDLASRETSPVTISQDVGTATALWPVGDGRHMLALAEDRLLLLDPVGGETRPLANGCTISRIGDPGAFSI